VYFYIEVKPVGFTKEKSSLLTLQNIAFTLLLILLPIFSADDILLITLSKKSSLSLHKSVTKMDHEKYHGTVIPGSL